MAVFDWKQPFFFMANSNSTFWKIEFPSGINSFLFGSMHTSDGRAYAKVNQIISYFDQVEAFYCELNLEKASAIPMDHFLFSRNESLKDKLSPKKYDQLQKTFRKFFDFNLDANNRFYPMLIANKIAEQILAKDRNVPLDAFLWQKAKLANLESDGMETFEDQITVLKEMPFDFQLKQLFDIKKKPDNYRKKVLRLVELYQAEKIKEIYLLSKNSLGAYRKKMLYDRNLNMSKFIIANNIKPSIFVMGAAHLDGNYGVLAYLKRTGISVRPIH